MALCAHSSIRMLLGRAAGQPSPLGARLQHVLGITRQQHSQQQPRRGRAPAAADAAAAAGEVVDEIDWTEDMPAPIKRRVAALREVQGEYDSLMKQFVRERAALQAKYEQQAVPLSSRRQAIIAGSEAVGAYDVPDSPDEPDEGIPDFWLTAIANHDLVGDYVTERDAEVLSHLTDVRVVSLTGDDAGSFRLEFDFADNPHFSNTTLDKTFYMENPDEVVPLKFVGCTIDWAPGKDTTVTVSKKKVGGKKGKGPAVTVNQTKPCDSFFNFFKTPAIPENPDDLSEEELEALQEQMDEDFEVAMAFKEALVPRAVEWYTGEAAQGLGYGDEYEDGDDYGAYEEEEAEAGPLPRGRRR